MVKVGPDVDFEDLNSWIKVLFFQREREKSFFYALWIRVESLPTYVSSLVVTRLISPMAWCSMVFLTWLRSVLLFFPSGMGSFTLSLSGEGYLRGCSGFARGCLGLLGVAQGFCRIKVTVCHDVKYEEVLSLLMQATSSGSLISSQIAQWDTDELVKLTQAQADTVDLI